MENEKLLECAAKCMMILERRKAKALADRDAKAYNLAIFEQGQLQEALDFVQSAGWEHEDKIALLTSQI